MKREPSLGYGIVNNSSAWQKLHTQQRNGVFCAVRADSNVTQQWKNCWKQCFLYSPYRGYIKGTSFHYVTVLRRQLEGWGWCEMAASLRGHETGSRGTSTAGRGYQAKQWKPWLRALVFVWWLFVTCSHELFKGSLNPITYTDPVYSHSNEWQCDRYLPLGVPSDLYLSSFQAKIFTNFWKVAIGPKSSWCLLNVQNTSF
jgi:hypothetical protein